MPYTTAVCLSPRMMALFTTPVLITTRLDNLPAFVTDKAFGRKNRTANKTPKALHRLRPIVSSLHFQNRYSDVLHCLLNSTPFPPARQKIQRIVSNEGAAASSRNTKNTQASIAMAVTIESSDSNKILTFEREHPK